ncbi:MAG: AMP-binding protein [Eubacterium sp.]|nr:AMP-binding protein [Eubacterium sp.]
MFLDIEKKRKMNPAAIQDNGAMITYGELTGFCREAIMGLPERSLIFCLCKNNIASVAGYVAVMSANCVPLMLSADIDEELLQALIDKYQPDYVWMPRADAEPSEDYWQVAHITGTSKEAVAERKAEKERAILEAKRRAAEKVSTRIGQKVDVTTKISGEVRFDRYGYDLVRLKSSIEEIEELARIPSEKEQMEGKKPRLHPDLALLLTTSGSTGSPKLVRQSRTNVLVNAASIVDYLEIGEFDRAITTLPMSYTYGLSIVNSHLLAGAELLLTDISIMQRDFWDFFQKEKASSLAGVPYTYEMLKKLKFMKMLLPSLKYMTQAGGRLRPELHKEFAEFATLTRKRFYVMYGQTEATARMAYLPYVHAEKKVGSIGVAIPGGALFLEDENGEQITEPHKVGELVYHGRNVTYGYAEELADLAKGDENDGVLHTGDMAEMDEDGYFFITGRKKRFLKIYGNRVSLDECEELIENHFSVECACTGEDDEMRIFVTGKIGEAVVVDFIAGKTGLNPKAFTVKNVPTIPRSGSGKKAYGELQ